MEEQIGCWLKSDSLKELLMEQATIIPSEYDESNWCYLPYWFKITPKGSVISYHINNLPDEIKNILLKQREQVERELKSLSI